MKKYKAHHSFKNKNNYYFKKTKTKTLQGVK